MELLKYSLLFPSSPETNLIYSNVKNKSCTKKIGYYFVDDNYNRNVKDFSIYLEVNKTVFENNINKLLNLSENLNKKNVDDMVKNTINKINNEFILYLLTDNEFNYNDVCEIPNIVYYINNSLFNLGEKIKLYNIKNLSDLKNIDGLTYLTLGEKEISNYSDVSNSADLLNLICELTGVYGFSYLACQRYGRNSIELSKCIDVLKLI